MMSDVATSAASMRFEALPVLGLLQVCLPGPVQLLRSSAACLRFHSQGQHKPLKALALHLRKAREDVSLCEIPEFIFGKRTLPEALSLSDKQ